MKNHSAYLAGILTACLCCTALHASAYTADDVAAKAKEAGWPDNLIQTGYNQWASGEYTQEQLDEAYNSVLDYNEQTEEFIYNSFGIDPDEAREKIKAQETVPDETAASSSGTETSSVTTDTVPDNFIPESDFISMTLQQKQEYVNSLGDDQKQKFISGLSTEARNSIIKQLPTEDKVAIMQNYIDTAGTMGMHVTVDEITDKDISLTVRNSEGTVIDKAEIGVVIDETGISHTRPLLFAGIGILLSAAGFGWLYWYAKHTEQDS